MVDFEMGLFFGGEMLLLLPGSATPSAFRLVVHH